MWGSDASSGTTRHHATPTRPNPQRTSFGCPSKQHTTYKVRHLDLRSHPSLSTPRSAPMAASLGFGGSKVSKHPPIQRAINPENDSVRTYPLKLPGAPTRRTANLLPHTGRRQNQCHWQPKRGTAGLPRPGAYGKDPRPRPMTPPPPAPAADLGPISSSTSTSSPLPPSTPSRSMAPPILGGACLTTSSGPLWRTVPAPERPWARSWSILA